MHELALMAELQRLAEEQANRHGAQRIHRLQLKLGALAGVDGEALRQAFAVLVAIGSGTELWRTAELELETVPARWFCANCGQPFTAHDQGQVCPRCGRLAGRLLAGQELELAALELS